MIKVEKDYSKIPASLELPFAALFPKGIPRPAKTTHKRRMEVINERSYIDEGNYNNRYKQDDTKIALQDIYNNKCAFCEQKVEQSHVEHYRPKAIYYWLAFSWDNLIMACPTCNQSKGTHFELQGVKINFINSNSNISKIHNLSTAYNTTELPKMVNPETTDPIGSIDFQKNGIIESKDTRFSYTIDKCNLDRKYLNDERRKLLDIFRRDLNSVFVEFSNPIEQKKAMDQIIRKFIRDSQDKELQFLGFRRYAIRKGWLKDIAKEMN